MDLSLTGGSWPHSLLTAHPVQPTNSVQSFRHSALSMVNSSLHTNKTPLKLKNPLLTSYWPWFLPFTASILKEPSMLIVHNVLFSPIPFLILTLFPWPCLHVGDPPCTRHQYHALLCDILSKHGSFQFLPPFGQLLSTVYCPPSPSPAL